jgi:hypothetical protein
VKMECGIVKIPSSSGGIAMRSPVLVLALTFVVACGGYAFAADEAPQPLTRADCDAAGMTWNDGTNVCGSADTMAAAPTADSSGDMAAAQPLTRADCDAAGMTWNDGANVCGSGATAAAQPPTRADCEAAGMKWNDGRNVCGVGRVAASAAAAAHVHKKEIKKEVKKGGTKIVKKVRTSHGVKKTVVHKKGHKHDAAAAKKGGFFQWLNGKNKKKS